MWMAGISPAMTMQQAGGIALMTKDVTIGLVVPFETDKVPDEGLTMYPNARFIPRGVGVRSLTPEGYDVAWAKIHAAADALAKEGVAAIMVIGTSLTFYRGYEAHEKLMEDIRTRTGLPVSTMSKAIVDGLKFFGARQVGVCTAYNDEVNKRLSDFLEASGFDVLALEGFGLSGFGEPGNKSENDIIALSDKVCGEAPEAEGLLISCGGLRTLGVAKPIEAQHDIPVVSSTQAAFWAAMRLVGESGHVAGCGRLLEQSTAPVH
jgi:arylmalonate decarboxylase